MAITSVTAATSVASCAATSVRGRISFELFFKRYRPFLRQKNGNSHVKHHADDVIGDGNKRAGCNGWVYF